MTAGCESGCKRDRRRFSELLKLVFGSSLTASSIKTRSTSVPLRRVLVRFAAKL